jgi:hypothetical protein
MDKTSLIKLSKEIYRLTVLFPKKEPLRYKIRDVATEILRDPKKEDLEVMDRFLEVAKSSNWVYIPEILAVQSEYANLMVMLGERKEQKIVAETESPEAKVEQKDDDKMERTQRQEKIMLFLKENKKAQVWEVKKVFSEISKRTLRRDFEAMLKQGLIQRIGERNDTYYQLLG